MKNKTKANSKNRQTKTKNKVNRGKLMLFLMTGSLEALMDFLATSGVPVRQINLGSVNTTSVVMASTNQISGYKSVHFCLASFDSRLTKFFFFGFFLFFFFVVFFCLFCYADAFWRSM